MLVSGLSLVDRKNIIERRDSTKSGQPSSLAEINHQQNQWILRTNNMVIKKNSNLKDHNVMYT